MYVGGKCRDPLKTAKASGFPQIKIILLLLLLLLLLKIETFVEYQISSICICNIGDILQLKCLGGLII